MEFFIRQGATEPILKMRLIDDGKNDKSSFNDMLENSDITFEMFNEISEEIIKAHQRNVAVKIITDNDKSFDTGSDIDAIHHKFDIFAGGETLILTTEKDYIRLSGKLKNLCYLEMETQFLEAQNKKFNSILISQIQKNQC